MLPNPIPDIQRTTLSHTILILKAMGINSLLDFDSMDPPPAQTMLTALYALSALDDDPVRKTDGIFPCVHSVGEDANSVCVFGMLGKHSVNCGYALGAECLLSTQGKQEHTPTVNRVLS